MDLVRRGLNSEHVQLINLAGSGIYIERFTNSEGKVGHAIQVMWGQAREVLKGSEYQAGLNSKQLSKVAERHEKALTHKESLKSGCTFVEEEASTIFDITDTVNKYFIDIDNAEVVGAPHASPMGAGGAFDSI